MERRHNHDKNRKDFESMKDSKQNGKAARRSSSQTSSSRSASDAKRNTKQNPQGKKKLKTWQKALLIALGVFVVLGIAAGAALLNFMNTLDGRLALDSLELGELQEVITPRPESPQEPFYILVLGSDAREQGAASRSDTIMLCRLDPEKQMVSVLSIPRDTKVEIAGYGTQKINAAMAFGGPAGAVTAVSNFVGVNISHVVMIDFEGFSDIIDRLGGVTVNVPAYSSYDGIELQPGVQTLNGAQALTFVRDRRSYGLGDFQRAANQRTLLKAVARKILQAPAAEIPGYVDSLAVCATTDLTSTQLIDLALSFRGMDVDADMYTGQVPSKTDYDSVNNISYVIALEDQWAEVREKYVSGTVPFVDASNQPAVID
ncbi:MAG: LCP family protein [Coriobacteriales bacterium]|jgi:LCP family protein required for cell wall assembly|nr:LCP family protein [Coriobacteriales bacterium]